MGDLDYGTDNDDAQPQEYNIVRRIPYPKYRYPQKYHDIALLRLDRGIRTSKYVKIACLSNARYHAGKRMTGMGWGQTEFAGAASTYLLKGYLKITRFETCSPFYRSDRRTLPYGIQDNLMICASGMNDACNVSLETLL